MISHLAEATIVSWLLYFSDQQYTTILDITTSPFDYYTGDEGHYSFKACLRKHTPSIRMSVPKLLIKVADLVYFELVVVLSHDAGERMQSAYVEEMNIFFSKPALGDPKRQSFRKVQAELVTQNILVFQFLEVGLLLFCAFKFIQPNFFALTTEMSALVTRPHSHVGLS